MNALKTKLKRILYNNGIYKYHKNNTNFIVTKIILQADC